MNKTEAIQALSTRLKSTSGDIESLAVIFEEYKVMVAQFSASDPALGTALRHLPEEFPDLQRLIGRKHDAILKGRLIDAISTLRKKVEALELQQIEQPDQPVDAPAEEKRVRNTPNLGME